MPTYTLQICAVVLQLPSELPLRNAAIIEVKHGDTDHCCVQGNRELGADRLQRNNFFSFQRLMPSDLLLSRKQRSI